ncbi:response regulator [bacterium]|nr:response regulator [bacterium]
MAAKILIIEDDRFLRELMARKLEQVGYEVVESVDGEDGLKKVSQEKPDLVLLDLILPGIDGFEVLSKVKEKPELSAIPVIILSNLGQREDIEKGLKLGAVDFLVKAHFTPNEIVDKVKHLLKK